MTVKDLIEKLSTMPSDAVVVINMMSECRLLDEDEPTTEQMIERNGTYMHFNENWWDYITNGPPKLITVCHFPGN